MNDVFGLQTLESMSQANWYNQWSVSKFKKYLKGRILEVGCGIGNLTKRLDKFGEVYAIDVNRDYISDAKFPKAVKVGYGDIEMGKYFFGKQIFDCIVCINVLEHIRNDSLALQNMSSLLGNKGILVLLVPLHKLLYNSIDQKLGHFRRYEKNSLLNKLKKAGFKILITRRLNFLGAIGWFIAGNILKNDCVAKDKIKIFNLLAPICLRMEDILEPIIGTSVLVIASKDIR